MMYESIMLFVCTVLFQVASATTTLDQGRSDCPNLFTNIGGKCYHFSADDAYTFDDARIFCQGLVDPVNGTADLAVLGFDYADFYHVVNYMNQAGMAGVYYVGLTDPFNKGDWMWLDGTPMSLSSAMWACDEPDMCTECFCAGLFRDELTPANRIQLADVNSCTTINFAMCQYGVSVKEGL